MIFSNIKADYSHDQMLEMIKYGGVVIDEIEHTWLAPYTDESGNQHTERSATLAFIKRETYAQQIAAYAQQLREKQLAGTTSEQRDGWGQKSDAADLVLLGNMLTDITAWLEAAVPETKPDGFDEHRNKLTALVTQKQAALALEATLVGETVDVTTEKVISKSTAFQTLANGIEGMQRKALNAIEAAPDDQLDTVYEQLIAEAKALEQQLGLADA